MRAHERIMGLQARKESRRPRLAQNGLHIKIVENARFSCILALEKNNGSG